MNKDELDFSEIHNFIKNTIKVIRSSGANKRKELNGKITLKFSIYKDGNKMRIFDKNNKKRGVEKIWIECEQIIEVDRSTPFKIVVSKTEK